MELLRKKNYKPNKYKKKQLNYFIDLGIAISSITLFIPGIIKFINLYIRFEILNDNAGSLSILHDWSGLVLGGFVVTHLVLHWKWLLLTTKKLPKAFKFNKKYFGYLVDIGMLISFLIILITGVMKFPAFSISRELLYNYSVLFLTLHDWSGIALSVLALTHVILHWKWIIEMTKRTVRNASIRRIGKILVWVSLIGIILFPAIINSIPISNSGEEIVIGGIGTHKFNPEEIVSIRPELFKEGHFSIFDILVHLDNNGELDMEYHFDPTMDTYVIDSINGKTNYWYYAYYDGGWQETNVFRMDHYPYKPKMYINLFTETSSRIESKYDTFREEINRLNSNNGSIIVPDIFIKGKTFDQHFKDIEITPHNLRNDTLQEGVITAIDVIMTLGDLGLITYRLNWYETIGTAEVKNYYVDEINGDASYARCGFVYEAGDLDFTRFRGNHIHIPADIRLINSPQYVEFFWICI